MPNAEAQSPARLERGTAKMLAEVRPRSSSGLRGAQGRRVFQLRPPPHALAESLGRDVLQGNAPEGTVQGRIPL
eukprot:9141602-Lingulodinium_polyedra.AAC.1